MCFEERKIPAAIVGILSVITLIISVVMIVLSIKFNNGTLSTNFGSMEDYTNTAFYILLGASVVAFFAACCGIVTCKWSNRCIAVIFGCTLLPAAALILIFGVVLTGVSHTDEATLKEFCGKTPEEFNETEAKGKWMAKIKETIEEVDMKVGSFVSKAMCSQLCPCDINDIPAAE